MAERTALTILIELAQRSTDEATKRLGKAFKAQAEAEQKLAMLEGYRDDYALRFEQAQAAGITPPMYFNFLGFMGKLDSAIKGQKDVIKHAQQRCAVEKTAWQACERKRLSYQTLDARAARAALALENKRDQKLMDEHAARQAYYKR
ncbi:MAG: flagellar export protein FliJ [Pseudomonadota bacterium]